MIDWEKTRSENAWAYAMDLCKKLGIAPHSWAFNVSKPSYSDGFTAGREHTLKEVELILEMHKDRLRLLKERDEALKEMEEFIQAVEGRLKLGCDCGNEYLDGVLTPYKCGLHEALAKFKGGGE